MIQPVYVAQAVLLVKISDLLRVAADGPLKRQELDQDKGQREDDEGRHKGQTDPLEDILPHGDSPFGALKLASQTPSEKTNKRWSR